MTLEEIKQQLNAIERDGGEILQVLPGWNNIVAHIVYHYEGKGAKEK